MIKSIQNIRVFLSSPSDVQIERSKVFKIADELNKNMSQVLGRRLEIVGWEEVVPSISRYAQNVITKTVNSPISALGMDSISAKRVPYAFRGSNCFLRVILNGRAVDTSEPDEGG